MAQRKGQTVMTRCIECDSRVWFKKHPNLGDITICPECDTQLEVIRTSPLELHWAYEEYDTYEEYNSNDTSNKNSSREYSYADDDDEDYRRY